MSIPYLLVTKGRNRGCFQSVCSCGRIIKNKLIRCLIIQDTPVGTDVYNVRCHLEVISAPLWDDRILRSKRNTGVRTQTRNRQSR